MKFITDEHGTPLMDPFTVDLAQQDDGTGPGPIRKVLLKPAYTNL